MIKLFNFTTITLLIAGGLNWFLMGAFNFNIVTLLLHNAIAVRSIYIIIGLSALYILFHFKKHLFNLYSPRLASVHKRKV